jgi:O-antigen/teichoic acid export membrane protein
MCNRAVEMLGQASNTFIGDSKSIIWYLWSIQLHLNSRSFHSKLLFMMLASASSGFHGYATALGAPISISSILFYHIWMKQWTEPLHLSFPTFGHSLLTPLSLRSKMVPSHPTLAAVSTFGIFCVETHISLEFEKWKVGKLKGLKSL